MKKLHQTGSLLSNERGRKQEGKNIPQLDYGDAHQSLLFSPSWLAAQIPATFRQFWKPFMSYTHLTKICSHCCLNVLNWSFLILVMESTDKSTRWPSPQRLPWPCPVTNKPKDYHILAFGFNNRPKEQHGNIVLTWDWFDEHKGQVLPRMRMEYEGTLFLFDRFCKLYLQAISPPNSKNLKVFMEWLGLSQDVR